MSEPVVIIFDEIEDWFENFWNSDPSRRNRNLNFLTTHSEIASESESKLIFIGAFPIHHQLMEILFQNYSSSKNYQNTRGMLYLLSSVAKETYQKESLILTSAVNPEIDEI